MTAKVASGLQERCSTALGAVLGGGGRTGRPVSAVGLHVAPCAASAPIVIVVRRALHSPSAVSVSERGFFAPARQAAASHATHLNPSASTSSPGPLTPDGTLETEGVTYIIASALPQPHRQCAATTASSAHMPATGHDRQPS